ncbi:MBOAT family O-acyltransferase [Stagnihabitans tardus]|uniref:Probable alginate O-acetylase AlgI n=1 Tax=Stagnihabitans tardus TaxID=2699202 RepID=A0AAE4YBK5_9RHOB|nr:MBOAT family protein [Stagnihabitans tardus]NBZ89656.1 MBOAT family protein [Stagnihabitans tardus]
MIFSDAEFWRFFAVVFLLYVVLPHRGQNWLLLGASYVFYGAWDWRFLGLLMFSTTADYGIGRALEASRDPVLRQRIVMLSVAINLGFLGFFKYFNFFTQSFIDLAQSFGFHPDPFTLSIALPVGISFYTFQSMSYTIDVYRGDLKPCRNFFDFALFVAFFPQLVAGPIVRATHLLPRVLAPRVLSWDAMGRGAVLCLTGLIKKIVIADGLAPLVDTVYGGGIADPTGAQVAFATWAFALQIYCDFSGYTDIARGVSKILGFELPVNFAQPYFATNPQEFWRRWHISLSTWLRDYLYISLGGNRGGRLKTYRNLFLTMLLGGIWHGAAWNYVLWGAYQGGLLCLHRALGWRGAASGPGPWPILRRIGLVILFFQVVSYGWLLFRAHSFGQIADFTARLGSLRLADFAALDLPPLPVLVGIACLFLWDLAIEIAGNPRFYMRWRPWARATLYATCIYLLVFGSNTLPAAFIYFQF